MFKVMPVPASFTGTFLTRAIVFMVYLLCLYLVVVAVRYIQSEGEVPLTSRKVPIGNKNNVLRGVGKWAKMRRGSFIHPLNKGNKSQDRQKHVNVDTHQAVLPVKPSVTIVKPKDKPLQTTLKASNLVPTAASIQRGGSALNGILINPSSINMKSPHLVRRLPDCLILGARKAGTGALVHFLQFHPQIRTAGRELEFFSNDENYNKGPTWYVSQMPLAEPDTIVIEKCAEYFHSRSAPARVFNTKKNMKLIVIVRDPFDRMVSDYFFLKRFAARETIDYPFKEVNHTLEELIFNKKTNQVLQYGGIRRSRYVTFLLNWLAEFPTEQIHIVNGDAFSLQNPAGELQKVEEFLNIKNFFNDDKFFYNETKGHFCTKMKGCLGSEKGHTMPTYDPVIVNAVRRHFVPYNEQFYKLVGHDFGWSAGEEKTKPLRFIKR